MRPDPGAPLQSVTSGLEPGIVPDRPSGPSFSPTSEPGMGLVIPEPLCRRLIAGSGRLISP